MMETLQLILFEYILGYGLQAFIIIFGIHTFSKQNIETKKYLLVSTMVAIITFLVRQLPISFGVHTIIDMLAFIILCIVLLKMPAIKVIRSMSIVLALLLISEMIGVLIEGAVFGSDRYQNMMNNPVQRAIVSVPINLLFLLLVTLFYYILKKKGDSNREISS